MKTKPKNFGNFFVRVGAGFLAFWLVTMGAFSLLLGQQRAELMAADIEDYAGRFLGNYAKYMLDSKEQDTDDPVELRKGLKQSIFELNTPEAQIIETAITDQSGNVLQSNRWWLKLKDDADTEYETDMDGQPQNVYEAIIIGSGVTELGKPIPNMSFEAWVDDDQAYLKSVTVRPNKVVDGEWVPTGEVNTVECAYDADKMSNLPLKTLTMSRMALPGWSENWTAKQTCSVHGFSGAKGTSCMGREPEPCRWR